MELWSIQSMQLSKWFSQPDSTSVYLVGVSFPLRCPTAAKTSAQGWQLYHGTYQAYGAAVPFWAEDGYTKGSPRALGCLHLGFWIIFLVCLSGRRISFWVPLPKLLACLVHSRSPSAKLNGITYPCVNFWQVNVIFYQWCQAADLLMHGGQAPLQESWAH